MMPVRGQCPVSGPSATPANSRSEWLFKQCRYCGGGNVILKTIGTVYRSLPSMGPCSEPRICLNSEHISARVTPQPTGRHPTRCCGWSRLGECPLACHCQRGHQPVPQRGNPLASEFIHSLPDKSVTLLDNRRSSVPTCCCVFRPKTPTVTGSSRNAGAGIHGTERYGDGDRLLQMTVSPRLTRKTRRCRHTGKFAQ